ncbi:hypothetical protein M0638_27255 [Roseomonas sp. NAR14]|uniref:Uncharacterized protein n=1 Tax=Roseomonas acroporae TaxID=2937791 RepID=A0A9X1YDB8_9PROT|nr:hypothetical protein [Roseomonas acroporae]MCK8788058.1 hypothetical protein [Roseomonas acroporae]
MAPPRASTATGLDSPAATPLAPADTDWLRHTLVVTGPSEAVARFAAAAAGAGVIPWVLDLDRMEEDWFLNLAAPPEGERAISLAGARILARRLRDAAHANHQRALARLDTDRRCPFDLQRLLPVPPAILRLGPEDPVSQGWLWAHWGTTRALRHVRALPAALDGRRKRMAELRVEFWSADWSPWPALRRLRRDWPDLTLDLRPHYDEKNDAPGEAEASEPERAMPRNRKGRGRTGTGRPAADRRAP